jgi:hypothetical protein
LPLCLEGEIRWFAFFIPVSILRDSSKLLCHAIVAVWSGVSLVWGLTRKYKTMACRPGPLLVERSLRDWYAPSGGASVGRDQGLCRPLGGLELFSHWYRAGQGQKQRRNTGILRFAQDDGIKARRSRYTPHEVGARTEVPTNRSSFVGWPSAVSPSDSAILFAGSCLSLLLRFPVTMSEACSRGRVAQLDRASAF